MHMANFYSTRARTPACLPGTTSCTAILKFTSALLTAVLVGCAGNVQHRSTNAQTEHAKPKPAPVAAAAPHQAAPPEGEAAPTVFKDDSQAIPEDVRPTERFADDAAEPQHEAPAPAQRFTDETSATADDQSS